MGIMGRDGPHSVRWFTVGTGTRTFGSPITCGCSSLDPDERDEDKDFCGRGPRPQR